MKRNIHPFSKILFIIGSLFIIAGLLWPLLQKMGLFHLPGDIVINNNNVHIYFPIATSILLSIILTAIMWLINRMRR